MDVAFLDVGFAEKDRESLVASGARLTGVELVHETRCMSVSL
jgi:hypothetical protein